MKVGIFEENFSKDLTELLVSKYGAKFFDGNYEEFLFDLDIVFIRLKHYVGKKILDKAVNLKYICSPTTGWNHIDVEEVKRRKIELISLKGEFDFLNQIRATPEHTFGLCLSLLRNYKELFLKNDSKWSVRDNKKGQELYGNKAGIIGYGRVGKILAGYLTSFGCVTSYYDILECDNKNNEVQKEISLDLLIEKSNIIFLCASYTQDNIEFINSKYIDLLKNKFFINTARGELVNESYLLEKIRIDWFKGVAIDVIANESGDNNLEVFLELSKNKNLIVTPHIAGATHESMSRTDLFILNKLLLKLEHTENGQ